MPSHQMAYDHENHDDTGVFLLVPLRKLFIIRYRLPFPSGTATGTIINGFHSPLGDATAKYGANQIQLLL